MHAYDLRIIYDRMLTPRFGRFSGSYWCFGENTCCTWVTHPPGMVNNVQSKAVRQCVSHTWLDTDVYLTLHAPHILGTIILHCTSSTHHTCVHVCTHHAIILHVFHPSWCATHFLHLRCRVHTLCTFYVLIRWIIAHTHTYPRMCHGPNSGEPQKHEDAADFED